MKAYIVKTRIPIEDFGEEIRPGIVYIPSAELRLSPNFLATVGGCGYAVESMIPGELDKLLEKKREYVEEKEVSDSSVERIIDLKELRNKATHSLEQEAETLARAVGVEISIYSHQLFGQKK